MRGELSYTFRFAAEVEQETEEEPAAPSPSAPEVSTGAEASGGGSKLPWVVVGVLAVLLVAVLAYVFVGGAG